MSHEQKIAQDFRIHAIGLCFVVFYIDGHKALFAALLAHDTACVQTTNTGARSQISYFEAEITRDWQIGIIRRTSKCEALAQRIQAG